jgi:hypothetical protein
VVLYDDPPNVQPGSAYVEIYELGPPPEHIGREGVWLVDPALPLAFERLELRGQYMGGFPFGSLLPVVIADRALEIHVLFGSRPTDEQLDDVNDLLESPTVEPAT